MTPKNPRSSASLGNGYGQKRSICLCTADKTFLTTKNHYWPVLMLVKILKWQNKRRKTCLAMFRVNRQTFVFAQANFSSSLFLLKDGPNKYSRTFIFKIQRFLLCQFQFAWRLQRCSPRPALLDQLQVGKVRYHRHFISPPPPPQAPP